MSSLVKIKLFCLNWLSRPLIRFVVLPGAVVYEALSYLSNNQEKNSSLAILTPSLLTALVGWLNSASLSHKGFVKTENSKAKDAISLFVDKFFDDYEELKTYIPFSDLPEDDKEIKEMTIKIVLEINETYPKKETLTLKVIND